MKASLLILILLLATTGCNHLFYYPDKRIFFAPEKLGLTYHVKALKTQDNVNLVAWVFPTTQKKVKGTIIQFHGNAENMSTHYLSLMWLIHQGYNLVTFDYRGYGSSEGKPSPKGTYLDGLSALDLAWQTHKASTINSPEAKFIVFGMSLGGAIAMRSLQDFEHSDEVSGVVLDSTFYSYRRVAYTMVRKSIIGTVISPLTWLFISDEYSGKRFLKNTKLPILVVHDQGDPVVPAENGLRTFNLINSKKEYWQPNLGRHTGTFTEDQSEWRKKLLGYLN